MKKDTWVWIIGVVAVLLVLVGTIGYVLFKNKNALQSVTKQNQTAQASQEDSGSSLLNVEDKNSISLGSGGNSLGLQTNLGQQSSGSTNSKQEDNFAVYEKYKDEKNALIGEIEEGTGPVADKGKKVALLYKGWLTNGSLVDESKPSQAGGKIVPLSFQIGGGQVIAGMEQGVFGMKEGGKRRIIIPPAVGYGDHGYGSIPANSVLIFDVELVSVQ